jgi:hypothetical protein
MAALILFVGLGIIVVAAVVARIQERPAFDQRGAGQKGGILPETDYQVEGLARAGELQAAIAMYVRVHRVDYKAARRAVAVLVQGVGVSAPARASLSPKTRIGQIMLGYLAGAQAPSAASQPRSHARPGPRKPRPAGPPGRPGW